MYLETQIEKLALFRSVAKESATFIRKVKYSYKGLKRHQSNKSYFRPSKFFIQILVNNKHLLRKREVEGPLSQLFSSAIYFFFGNRMEKCREIYKFELNIKQNLS